jgi:hypothetical protein
MMAAIRTRKAVIRVNRRHHSELAATRRSAALSDSSNLSGWDNVAANLFAPDLLHTMPVRALSEIKAPGVYLTLMFLALKYQPELCRTSAFGDFAAVRGGQGERLELAQSGHRV